MIDEITVNLTLPELQALLTSIGMMIAVRDGKELDGFKRFLDCYNVMCDKYGDLQAANAISNHTVSALKKLIVVFDKEGERAGIFED